MQSRRNDEKCFPKMKDTDTVMCRPYICERDKSQRATVYTGREYEGRPVLWSILIRDLPFRSGKAWPKITWIHMDRKVLTALRHGLPLPNLALERLGMEVVQGDQYPAVVSKDSRRALEIKRGER